MAISAHLVGEAFRRRQVDDAVVVVSANRLAERFREPPGTRQQIADDGVIGAVPGLLDGEQGQPAFLVGRLQRLPVIRETPDHQRNAAIVKQTEAVGRFALGAGQAVGQPGAQIGGAYRTVPVAFEPDAVVGRQRFLQQLPDHQVEHPAEAENLQGIGNRTDFAIAAEGRRVDDAHHGAGQSDIAADQLGNGAGICILPAQFRPQFVDDCRARRDIEALDQRFGIGNIGRCCHFWICRKASDRTGTYHAAREPTNKRKVIASMYAAGWLARQPSLPQGRRAPENHSSSSCAL